MPHSPRFLSEPPPSSDLGCTARATSFLPAGRTIAFRSAPTRIARYLRHARVRHPRDPPYRIDAPYRPPHSNAAKCPGSTVVCRPLCRCCASSCSSTYSLSSSGSAPCSECGTGSIDLDLVNPLLLRPGSPATEPSPLSPSEVIGEASCATLAASIRDSP